jgi:CDP-diacylglycerol--serine O-phosphatidyltransferase
VLSAVKLVIVAPALAAVLQLTDRLVWGPLWVGLLFGSFAALDYLDGVVARARSQSSYLGRAFDRATDYPVLVVVTSHCLDVLPTTLLLLKLGLDLLLLVLYAVGRGSTENRVRTVVSYATLLSLLLLSQGWLEWLVEPALVSGLLCLNVGLSTAVALHNLGILRRRRVADLLSAGNLACGVAAAILAIRGRVDWSLLLVVAAMAFDGLDGCAARRWGSGRYGVLVDDVADAVSFAMAPAVAVVATLGGVEGWIVGTTLGICTVGRLVYFTLNKGVAPPGFFQGAPSPMGAVVVLAALTALGAYPRLVGFVAGLTCALMISFSTHYRHLGRAIAARPGWLLLLVPSAAGLLAAGTALGAKLPAAFLLTGALLYGLLPMATAFGRACRDFVRSHRRQVVA